MAANYDFGAPVGPLPRSGVNFVPFCLEFFNLGVLDNFGSFRAVGYGEGYTDEYDGYDDLFGDSNLGRSTGQGDLEGDLVKDAAYRTRGASRSVVRSLPHLTWNFCMSMFTEMQSRYSYVMQMNDHRLSNGFDGSWHTTPAFNLKQPTLLLSRAASRWQLRASSRCHSAMLQPLEMGRSGAAHQPPAADKVRKRSVAVVFSFMAAWQLQRPLHYPVRAEAGEN